MCICFVVRVESLVQQNDGDPDHCADSNQAPIDVTSDNTLRQ